MWKTCQRQDWFTRRNKRHSVGLAWEPEFLHPSSPLLQRNLDPLRWSVAVDRCNCYFAHSLQASQTWALRIKINYKSLSLCIYIYICKSHKEDIEWCMAWTDKGPGGLDMFGPFSTCSCWAPHSYQTLPDISNAHKYFRLLHPFSASHHCISYIVVGPLRLGDLLPGCPGAPWFWQTQEVHAAKCCKPAGPGNCYGGGRAFAALRALPR